MTVTDAKQRRTPWFAVPVVCAGCKAVVCSKIRFYLAHRFRCFWWPGHRFYRP